MTDHYKNDIDRRIEADPDDRWAQSVSLVAANGKPVGQAELRFYDDIQMADGYHYKRLKQLIVIPPEGGEPIDILAMHPVMSRISIFIPGKATTTSNIYRRSSIKMSKPIENHADIVILMHEMRHAEQDKDEGGEWEKISRLNDNVKSGWNSFTPAYLRHLFELFPGLQGTLAEDPAFMEYLGKISAIDDAIQANLKKDHLEESRAQAMVRGIRNGARRALSLVGHPYQPQLPPEDLGAKYRQLMAQMVELEKTFETQDILYIPTLVMEWDANQKALARAREIQSRGVDLLAPCVEVNETGESHVIRIERELERAVTTWIRNQKGRQVPYPISLEDIFKIYRR